MLNHRIRYIYIIRDVTHTYLEGIHEVKSLRCQDLVFPTQQITQ